MIINHRESERYLERWDWTLKDLSKCKVITIPKYSREDTRIGEEQSSCPKIYEIMEGRFKEHTATIHHISKPVEFDKKASVMRSSD